jgi:ABC transporter fused permease/ATP-binding protein
MDKKEEKKQSPIRRFKRLISYALPFWRRLVVSFVCLAVAGGLGLVYPMYFGRVIDAAFTDKDLSELNQSAIVLVLLFAFQAVFVFFRYYLVAWVGERAVADLRVEIYRHIVTLPQSFFHRTRTGELLSRLSDDVTRVQSVVGTDLSTALRSTISLIGAVTILFWTNPKLTAIMLGVIPPLAVVSRLWGRTIWNLSRRAQDSLAKAAGGLQEGIAAMETVQAFTREDYEVSQYKGNIESSFEMFIRRAKARAWFFSVATFLAFSSIAGIFWMGGRMVAQGEISAGDLTQFMLYTMMIAASVGSFAGLWSNLSAALGATARIFEILDEKPDIADHPDAVEFDIGQGRVEFDNVSFAYPGREGEVVRQIRFNVEPGKVCALVGSSGSGKTTIGRLLLRFYDPQQGEIRVDGQPIHRMTLSSLRGAIALVAQEAPLFSGPVRENILYGRLEAREAELKQAARLANADEFIAGFVDGYDTVVGERGIKLSGGQRQRVAIARAILRDPSILVLDEATSALDAESEGIVQAALDELEKGRTTLVIAHRLSTIRHADQIVVMDQGEIVETGRHEELMERGGVYAHLVARQAENHN